MVRPLKKKFFLRLPLVNRFIFVSDKFSIVYFLHINKLVAEILSLKQPEILNISGPGLRHDCSKISAIQNLTALREINI